MKIAHISDLHFWHVTLSPSRLMGKRFLGMGNLLLNRARKYRMETMPALVERMRALNPDHVLITGDLTTTSLEEEFLAVRLSLEPLKPSRDSMTVIPGNHDRYTHESIREGLFEKYFGEFAALDRFPYLKSLGEETALLCFDPCRPTGISALGLITMEMIREARALVERSRPEFRRLLIACHYPVALPAGIVDSRGHGLRGGNDLREFLAGVGPAVYCHGHVHANWAFIPRSLPQIVCLDPGAAVKRRTRSGVAASMLEVRLEGGSLRVQKHLLRHGRWITETMLDEDGFFFR